MGTAVENEVSCRNALFGQVADPLLAWWAHIRMNRLVTQFFGKWIVIFQLIDLVTKYAFDAHVILSFSPLGLLEHAGSECLCSIHP